MRADVTLGGGAKTFTETANGGFWAGKTLWEQADARGYQTVQTLDELNKVTQADQSAPLLGLFTDGNFPVRFDSQPVTQNGVNETAVTCQDNPARLASGLSLASLTDKAIDLLDNEDGFFLQVEGASIDKQDHAANACGQIGETIDLDEAVQVGLEYAKEKGDTLVVVTADHAHTSQIVDSATPGLNIKLHTVDGSDMIVSYGTAPKDGSQQHTGSQVRIAAYGPGAANVVGLTDQTDLFFTVTNTLGLERDLAAQSAAATGTFDGTTKTVSVSGLKGDFTTTAKLADGTDLGQADVIDGVATFTLPASFAGKSTVTVTGKQTTKTVDVAVDLTAAPTTPTPTATPTTSPTPTATPSGSASAAPVVAAPGKGGKGGSSMPITGAAVAGLLGAAAMSVGAGALLRRRAAARA